jgi:hypothetical protein
MGMHRGQGATEYLVLLAVVLIIALVSVALLGFFPGMASDSQVAQSQAYWSGTARPFQAIEASPSVESVCGFASASGYTLVLQNTEADALTVTGISIDNSSGFCVAGGAANAPVVVGPGERRTFFVKSSSLDVPCSVGEIVQADMNITFSTAFLSNKVQTGAKKLVLRRSVCNSAGGNVTEAGGYRIHTFRGSGTFTPTKAMNIEVLVVAGGGGSGGAGNTGYYSGGGGGGGVIYNPSYAVTAGQSITVTVGAGGSAGFQSGDGGRRGGNGGNSVFGSLVAVGGGGGGGNTLYGESVGASGGSGGGGALYNSAGGAGTAGQGNAGGKTNSTGGGGGGGAGSAGGECTSNIGGAAGNGISYSISGTSIYYAGGGAAPGVSGAGSAGSAGGTAAYAAGAANTGAGGGGVDRQPGRAGGSGVVIVRYQ